MFKIFLFIFSINFFCGFSHAQSISLQGKITDATTGEPLENASVFLNSTSYGTVSNKEGKFELNNLVPGKYELIVTFIGYETVDKTLSDKDFAGNININLKQKSQQLQDVIVKTFDPDGWKKWGQFFIDNFIGTSQYAQDCSLKNSTAIKFHYSKNKNELTAFANEPLIVENNALGYVLKYQLEEFSYNFDSKFITYEGYPFFQEMTGSDKKKRKWNVARNEVYKLSLMHFMRSLFINKLTGNGYTIYPEERFKNVEKERIQEKEKKYYNENKTPLVQSFQSTLRGDSLDHYNKIMHEMDPIEVIHAQLFSGDSIAYAVDANTAALDFSNYLIVRIPDVKVPDEYIRNDNSAQPGQPITSVIYLADKNPVMVAASGFYYNCLDLITEGFWSWWEKLGTMLPYNFEPDLKN